MLVTTCSTVCRRVCLLRGLLSLGGAVASVYCVLIGFVSLVRRQLDAVLGTGIDVLDRLAVVGRELIQFVDPVADRLGLLLHVLLAGERIQLSPESFVGLRLERRFAAGASLSGGGGILVGGRGSLLVGSRLGGLLISRLRLGSGRLLRRR